MTSWNVIVENSTVYRGSQRCPHLFILSVYCNLLDLIKWINRSFYLALTKLALTSLKRFLKRKYRLKKILIK